MNINSSSLITTAIEAALEAGNELRKGFDTSFDIQTKPGRHNLVTHYDKLAERLIISSIGKKFPDHSILAEESGAQKKNEEITWVIDPLDGTVNFAHSIPNFCVSIAVAKGNDVICGVVYQPITQELFTAEKGLGARLNGKHIKVSKTLEIKDAILATGFPYNVEQNPLHCIDQVASILHMGLPIRRIGSAALDLCYTAAGRFDGYWECSLEPWDIAAGKLLVEEAGGTVTDYEGMERFFHKKTSVVASNSLLHNAMIHTLRCNRNDTYN
ncbi:MAG: inositol monophosphatase [Chlamydiae bacterium]|nr:inositol monophosphatase [Chlamydiota bacterium]